MYGYFGITPLDQAMGSEAHISGLEIRARHVGRYLRTCEKFEERGAQCLKDDDEFAGGPSGLINAASCGSGGVPKWHRKDSI